MEVELNINTGIYWNGTEYRYVKDGKDVGGIDSMPAGREMDALVAEQVMGWKIVQGSEWNPSREAMDQIPYEPHLVCWMDGTLNLYRPLDNPVHGWSMQEDWYPSSDIAAAWMVVEKISLLHNWDLCPIEWKSNYSIHTVCFVIYDSTTSYTGKGSTAPLAICRAALKAVMK